MATQKIGFPKTQQRYVDRYVDMLWNDPENADMVGRGDKYPTKASLRAALLALNNEQPWVNTECDNRKVRGLLIPGKVLYVPEGFVFHEIKKEVDCKPKALPAAAAAAPVAMAVDAAAMAAPPPPPAAEAIPLAQFVPPPSGAVELNYALQRYNYFFGKPPRDAAARGDENPDRLKNGALLPGQMEGQASRLRQKTDKVGDVLAPGAEGNYYFGRARKQELTYGPEATFIRQTDGKLVPNPRFNAKLEENLGDRIVDGEKIETVMGGALISLARRNNPYHATIFTDFDTARNEIGKWNATAEAVTVITRFKGIMEQYPTVADRFLKGGNPTAEDARALLEMNAGLALNPLVWSVSSRGVPIGNIASVQQAAQDVFASDAFKKLPPEQQAALHTEFDAKIALMPKHEELFAAVGGEEGVKKLYDPLAAMVPDIANDRYKRKKYHDGIDDGEKRPEGMSVRDFRTKQTADVGYMYASEIAVEATRPPRKFEEAVAKGDLFNTATQSAEAIRASRTDAIGKIANEAPMLDDVISHVVSTKGAAQKWTDLMFIASRKSPKGNRGVLGFQTDAEADKYARNAAEKLFGKEHRDDIEFKGTGLFSTLANVATFGLATPGAKKNQLRGLYDDDNRNIDLQALLKDRWEHGDEATRQGIREVFRDISLRANAAQANGKGYASAGIMTSLDPALAAKGNHNVESETYQRIRAAIPAVVDSSIQAYNARENLAAEVLKGTRDKVVAGENPATAFNMDPLKAAIAAGAPLAAMTAGEPGKVTQGLMNRETVLNAAATNSLAFSITTLSMMSEGNLNAGARQNMEAYLTTVDKGTGDSNRYADMMKHHAKALKAAAGNPDKLAAAQDAAVKDLSAYFAAPDSKHAGARAAAAGRLASQMAQDDSVSAAFHARLLSVASGGLNAEQTKQFQALGATIGSNGFIALDAKQKAEYQALRSISDSKGLDAKQLKQLQALDATIAANGLSTLDATQQASFATLTAAAGSDALKSLTAEQKAQWQTLNAGGGSPAELAAKQNAFFAGLTAQMDTLDAKPGVSWRRIVETAAPFLIPGGKSSPDVIRGGVDECLRGTCVIRPGNPTPGVLPNIPLNPFPRPGRPLGG